MGNITLLLRTGLVIRPRGKHTTLKDKSFVWIPVSKLAEACSDACQNIDVTSRIKIASSQIKNQIELCPWIYLESNGFPLHFFKKKTSFQCMRFCWVQLFTPLNSAPRLLSSVRMQGVISSFIFCVFATCSRSPSLFCRSSILAAARKIGSCREAAPKISQICTSSSCLLEACCRG